MKKIAVLLLSFGALCAAEYEQDGHDQNVIGPKEQIAMAANIAAQQDTVKEDSALLTAAVLELEEFSKSGKTGLEEIKKDLSMAEKALKYAYECEVFASKLISDIKEHPKNYAVVAWAGSMVGIFVAKRFLSLGRLHRKVDTILTKMEKGNITAPTAASRKSLIIQQ